MPTRDEAAKQKLHDAAVDATAIPTLNLDDIDEPVATFTFRGKDYNFAPWSSFGLMQQKKIQKMWQRIIEIESMQDFVEQDEAKQKAMEVEHSELRMALLSVVSDIDGDTATELGMDKQGAVLVRFFRLRATESVKLSQLASNVAPPAPVQQQADATKTKTTTARQTSES